MIDNQPSAAGSDCLRAESTMRGGERRQRRISLRIVVAAYALVYPTVLAIGYFSPNAMRLGVLLTVFLVWLTSSTSCLFGIWTIYGEPRFWWRLVFVVAGVLYCYAMTVSSMLFSLFSSFGQVSQMPMSLLVVFFLFFCCYSLSVIGIAVAFLVIERFGARLVLLDTVSLEKREQPFQFTLRSLIGFGVVVAVLLATYRSSSVYDSETNFQSRVAAWVRPVGDAHQRCCRLGNTGTWTANEPTCGCYSRRNWPWIGVSGCFSEANTCVYGYITRSSHVGHSHSAPCRPILWLPLRAMPRESSCRRTSGLMQNSSQRHRQAERLQPQELNGRRHFNALGNGLPFADEPRSPCVVIPVFRHHPIQCVVLRLQGVICDGAVDDGSACLRRLRPKAGVLVTSCDALKDGVEHFHQGQVVGRASCLEQVSEFAEGLAEVVHKGI